jgi:threonine dehydratase
MVRECVDEMMLVSEDEIAGAMAYAWQAHGQKVEGSGAVGLAAAISGRITARPLVIIVSGGNVGEEIFGGILSGCTGKTL